jgi:hypothetical protein
MHHTRPKRFSFPSANHSHWGNTSLHLWGICLIENASHYPLIVLGFNSPYHYYFYPYT